MFDRIKRALRSKHMILFLVVLALAAIGGAPALAQTPVPLEIPTNEIFSSTNSWMTTFAPIVSIGIGITLALAILGFIGTTIVKGIKGAGKG
jgi:hypothetical protein